MPTKCRFTSSKEVRTIWEVGVHGLRGHRLLGRNGTNGQTVTRRSRTTRLPKSTPTS